MLVLAARSHSGVVIFFQFTHSGLPAGLVRVVAVPIAVAIAVLVIALPLRSHVDGQVLLGCQALQLEEQVARQDDEV